MYLDEGGDYKDEEGNSLDVVIDPALTEPNPSSPDVEFFRWGPNPEIVKNKIEEDYIWMPNSHAARQTNLALIAQKWFDFSLTVDNSKNQNPVLSDIVLADN